MSDKDQAVPVNSSGGTEIPDDCTITLPEGVTIPVPKVEEPEVSHGFSNEEPSTSKQEAMDEVQALGEL